MPTTVDIKDIAGVLRLADEDRRRAVKKGLLKAALKGEAIVAADTPVDTGLTRNQWVARSTPDGAELVNDSPIAGILEMGSRPHKPPLRPIVEWVVRTFGTGKKSFENYDEVEPHLMGIAYAIVRKIESEGTKPNYMVKKNLERLAKIAKREVEEALQKTVRGGSSFD